MGFVQLVRQRLAQLIRQMAGQLARQQAERFSTGKATPTRKIGHLLLSGLIGILLFSCANRSESVRLLELPDLPSVSEERRLSGSISEVAPPAIFSDLDELIADTRPRVTIAEPRPDQTLNITALTPKINLRGLSIYKDKELAAGPHLQVILDNQPAQSLYSLDEAIEFLELAPGSHTLRVIAVKPWGESFKNEEAYAQTTFHVLAKTNENTPDSNQPQLIYSAPQGTYGAQPVLLDFYLNNAPLHLLAAGDPDITDWRIRCDVNGQSFVFDQWQPIYLKGFKPGQNWVQLTLIDEQGNPIKNAFNSTVRIVDFDPERRDTLAKMTRGELTVRDVGQIVVSDYEPPVEIVVPLELDGSDQPEIEEAVELEKAAKPEGPTTAIDDSKEPLEEDLLEEDLSEENLLEEDLSEEAPSESEQEAEEASEEAIAPVEGLDEPKEIEPGQLAEESASDQQVTDVVIEETVVNETSAETSVDNIETDESGQADEDVVDRAPQNAQDKPGFFARIKTFWTDLEESQPVPVSEPDVEITETVEIIETPIEAPETSSQLLIDSPLLIPERQPSDLN